ncbi:MAG: hypothetical protein JSW15_07280 [Deltaproteobacteria bacterium]|nr:MAG: hypothetical protein JSW15_07280 [Deltaproteobacteria bacterium]
MKKLIKFFSSLELTLILMILVAIWFALGALLSVSSQYGSGIRLLNDQLVGKSLFELPHLPTRMWSPLFSLLYEIQKEILSGLPSPEVIVVSWLWGVFILLFLLGVNLIFGSKEWFFDIFKRRLDFRKFLLLTMHFLFGIVLLGHLVSAVSGFKVVGKLPTKEGEKIEFLNRYTLRVDKISTEPEDSSLATRGGERKWVTPDRFIKQQLSVSFTLYDKRMPIFRGEASTFEPVDYQGFHFTLIPFSFRSQVSHDFMGRGVGSQIAIFKNPGIPIIMISQPLWILVLLVYVITIFRSRDQD